MLHKKGLNIKLLYCICFQVLFTLFKYHHFLFWLDVTENTAADVVSTIQTETSYNSNTFILLESEDETKTESDYSYTESYASSSVFSPSLSTESSTQREWKDITEIVKE